MIDPVDTNKIHALHDAGGWWFSDETPQDFIDAAVAGGFNTIKSWSWTPGGSSRMWDDWNVSPASTIASFTANMNQYLDAGLGLILDVGDSRGIMNKYGGTWSNFPTNDYARESTADYYWALIETVVDHELFLYYSPFAEPVDAGNNDSEIAACITAIKNEINERAGTSVPCSSDIGYPDWHNPDPFHSANVASWKTLNSTCDIASIHQYFCQGTTLGTLWNGFKGWADDISKPLIAGEWGFQGSCQPASNGDSWTATRINRMMNALTANNCGSAFWTFYNTGTKIPNYWDYPLSMSAFASHGFDPWDAYPQYGPRSTRLRNVAGMNLGTGTFM